MELVKLLKTSGLLEALKPLEPVGPVEPLELLELVEPVEPVGPVEPVEPVEPVGPIESLVTSGSRPRKGLRRPGAGASSQSQNRDGAPPQSTD